MQKRVTFMSVAQTMKSSMSERVIGRRWIFSDGEVLTAWRVHELISISDDDSFEFSWSDSFEGIEACILKDF